ncbi:hypothetical protein Bca101_041529 [Brassica carinata]
MKNKNADGFLIHLHDSSSTVNVPLSLHLPTFDRHVASVEVTSNLKAEAVDFEPEEDDFMDEDVGAADVSPCAGHLRISGSIDGKVRKWDVRDIVTAVCYRPDAKAAVIGSITGNCRFYHILDNQLQMDSDVNLSHGKKKVPSKRITGLEYFPSDWDKVMFTIHRFGSYLEMMLSASLKVRNEPDSDESSGVCTTAASFTLDGKHIVSTTEDSGIHVWNNSELPSKKPSSRKPKRIRSYESFISQNASVAIPWLRQANRNSLSDCITDLDKKIGKMDSWTMPPQR